MNGEDQRWMQAATQRTIDASPAFMEYGLAKKIAA